MRAKNTTETVNANIYRCITEHSMLTSCSGVLVGFSGGVDSTVLLFWLSKYCAEHGLQIAALHVNHKIRGKEADRDEDFCRSFCELHSIHFICRSADVPAAAAKRNCGIEETARDIRYETFNEAASKLGFNRIATAHNADDNLETVIFNLARGTGAQGLAGIPPVRGNIIRPLLYCEKSELILYCTENKLDYVLDSTNADTAYTRNYIRREIIPLIEKINPAVRSSTQKMCSSLREDSLTLTAISDKFSLSDGRKELADLDNSLLVRVLSREFRKYSNGFSLESAHLKSAVKLIRSDRSSFSLSLPKMIKLLCERDFLSFDIDTRKRERQPVHFSVKIQPGANKLPNGMLLAVFEKGVSANDKTAIETFNNNLLEKYIKEHKNIYKLFIQGFLRSDRIVGVLSAETPRGSAKIRFRGMSRTVKNLLAEQKLTKTERQRIIMICDGDGPLWIPGVAMRDGCEAEPGGRNTLILVHFFI